MCMKKYPCEKEKDSKDTYLIVNGGFLKEGKFGWKRNLDQQNER